MKNLKLVETASEAVQNEYLTIYGVKEDGSVVIKVYGPTIWYYSDGTTYEELVVGEFDSSKGHHGSWQTIESVHIGKDVTSIGNRAFYACASLTSVTIPNSVTSIGNSAFGDCTSLTSIGEKGSGASVEIPNSVTSINGNAFENCPSLTSVTIPNSVTSISDACFANCSGLASVTIPNSVTSIGFACFANCSGLASVTYNGTIAQWNAITKGTDWKYQVPTTCKVHCTDGDIAI